MAGNKYLNLDINRRTGDEIIYLINTQNNEIISFKYGNQNIPDRVRVEISAPKHFKILRKSIVIRGYRGIENLIKGLNSGEIKL